MSESTDRPTTPATAPLRGPRGSLLYSGSDGNQYIVDGGLADPRDAPLPEAFQVLRAGAPQLEALTAGCRAWVDAASGQGLSRQQAASVLLGQLAQALEVGEGELPLPP
jgi:hypothetical protein